MLWIEITYPDHYTGIREIWESNYILAIQAIILAASGLLLEPGFALSVLLLKAEFSAI